MTLADIIRMFAQQAQRQNVLINADSVARLLAYFNSARMPKLRIFVSRASGFGHQANTVTILRRLIDLGFVKEVQVIYDNTPSTETPTTIEKLAILLPGLNPVTHANITLDNVVLSFHPYIDNQPVGFPDMVPLCINGGAENEGNLCPFFNVQFYLQLQPFLWREDHALNALWQLNVTAPVMLTEVVPLGANTFFERAFYVRTAPLTPADWAHLAEVPNIDGNMLGRARIICDCFNNNPPLRQIDFYPIYGLPWGDGRKAIPGTPKSIAFVSVLAAALMPAQNRPLVVAILSPVSVEFFDRLGEMFSTQPLPFDESDDVDEWGAEGEPDTYSFSRRKEEVARQWAVQQGVFLHDLNHANGRIQVMYEPTGHQLSAAILAAANNTIIITAVKNTPQILYNQLFEIATLPPIFEGQGTANYVLNSGKPYFQMAKQNINPYPTGVLVPNLNVGLSQQIVTGIWGLQSGIFDFANNPNAAQRLSALMVNCIQPASPLVNYFTQVSQFYHSDENDKLLMSVLWWLSTYNPDANNRLILKNADENVLQTLFDALTENAQSGSGVLNLFSVLNSFSEHGTKTIIDYLASIIGNMTLDIGSPSNVVSIKWDKENPAKGITVKGVTDAFAGPSLEITLVFKLASDNTKINTNINLAIGNFNLPGVEWFKLDTAAIGVEIPGDGNRIQGNAELTVKFGDTPAKFSMGFPVKENLLLFDASFTDDKPNLDKVFQILGGTDFNDSLPDPIKVITNTGLKDFKFLYNYAEKKIESFNVNLENKPPTPWVLVGKLQLAQLNLNIAVVNPTGNRQVSWAATSSFAIGGGAIDFSISYPKLKIAALLKEGDENKISLGDLFTFFLSDDTSLDVGATLSDFEFTMNPSEDQLPSSYLLRASLESDQWNNKKVWSVNIGNHLFSLDEIKVEIESNGKEGNQRDTTGYLLAVIGLFGNASNPADTVLMNLMARYLGTDKGWMFSAKQGDKPIEVIKIIGEYVDPVWAQGDIPKLDISGLFFQLATGGKQATENAYLFGGKINTWADTPLGDVTTSISGEFGYFPAGKNPFAESSRITTVEKIKLRQALPGYYDGIDWNASPSVGEQPMYHAFIEGRLLWNGIDLRLFFDYKDGVKKYGIQWNGLLGYIQQKGNEYEAKLTFTETTTVGSIVETMISWATGSAFGLSAPWNLLNKISLSNLELVYTFKKVDGKTSDGKVSLNVNFGPIDLGFATIKGFKLSYNNGVEYLSGIQTTSAKEVIVTLEGSFFWQVGDGQSPDTPISWNAADPENSKTPPGDGNAYFDLRYLGLGQHITFTGITEARTIQKAIEIMSAANPPSSKKVPDVQFDAKSNWLIGADFGLLKLEEKKKGEQVDLEEQGDDYFITAQLVFNDPYLYGIRLALAGEAAKIFSGLDFQIMYRQISETVGVYQSEITLPDYMRRLTIGAYTIVLPVFGIAVYTNGDFQIDVGFPWNENFARSMTIEAMIGPIPIVGSAGFYFGKLSSDTSDKVPAATNGTFNPVIVFGFGFQVGVGKSFEFGVLKAGFSLTLLTIIEGVLAKWNPYELAERSDSQQVQGQYYFYLSGTLGIAGKLYGSIDFAIIKAEVNIQLALLAQIIYESFEPIIFTVFVKVSATASVVINLGLFKIKFSFSFALDVKQTFYIDNGGNKPWITGQLSATGVLRQPVERRLYDLRISRLRATYIGWSDVVTPVWSNLQPATSPDTLVAYLGFAATLAGEQATTPAAQQTCSIASLVLEADPVPSGLHENHGLNKAMGLDGDKSFDVFAKRVLLWCIAAVKGKSISLNDLLNMQVTEAEIKGLLNYLDEFADNPTPIPIKTIEDFMTAQFKLKASIPATQNTEVTGTYFPMPRKLNFKVSADGYPGYTGYEYSYADYNSLSPEYLRDLRTWFNDIAVQVEKEQENGMGLINADGPTGPSLAEFIMTDYFLLIARHMLRAMNSGLRNFVYLFSKGQSVQQILDVINTNADHQSNPEFTAFDLFEANAAHPLTPDDATSNGIQVGGGQYFSLAGHSNASFQTIARDNFYQEFTAFELAAVNAAQKIIKKGIKVEITVDGKSNTYYTNAVESLNDIAAGLKVTISLLLQLSDLLTREDIFEDSASSRLDLPYFKTYVVAGGDSFSSIAGQSFGEKTATDIAMLNATAPVLNAGVEVIYTDGTAIKYTTSAGDSLESVAWGLGNVSLANLLSKSTVLASTELLITTVSLFIPPFYYKRVEGDTLTSIAEKLSISIALLADNQNNLTIVDLFSDASKKTLNIPHLNQYKCSELINELQRAGSIEQLGAMLARYYFHSLRLPTAGIKPEKEGMWVINQGGQLSYQIPDAGIFALSGQQFPVPALVAAQGSCTVTFDTKGAIPWLDFDTVSPQTIAFTFSPVSTDPGYPNFQEIQSLADFARANKKLDSGIEALRQGRMYTTELVTYAFSQPGLWLSGNKFAMPYSDKAVVEYNQLQLWRLPDGLMDVLSAGDRRIIPSFKVKKGAYNEASGKTDSTCIDQYAWSSIFKVTVKKIIEISQSPNTKYTYEILGATDNDIILLDSMVRDIALVDELLSDIIVAFGTDNSNSDKLYLKSADKNQLTIGVNKVNLSTDSNPPDYGVNSLVTGKGKGILNKPLSDFVKLIWEASITRTGGFYLYYFDADSSEGLPSDIFNDKNEATLYINLLFSKPAEQDKQNRLYGFMNQFITAETFDLAKYSVFAEGIPKQVVLTSADLDFSKTSLEDLKHLYLGNIDGLATTNKDVQLRPQTQRASFLKIPNGSFMITPLGVVKTLEEIASRFNVNAEEIKRVNRAVKSWTGPLPDYLALKLPPHSFQVQPGGPDTLAAIAGFFGEDIVSLAWQNAQLKGIFPDTATITLSGGAPTTDNPTVPAGVIPYKAICKVPAAQDPVIDPATYADKYLPWAYSLLGFHISANQDFQTSKPGLPVGPTNTAALAGSDDKVNFVRELNADEKWEYELALSYTKLLGQSSPYAGIGKLLQVQFKWQDIFGNKIISDFDEPAAGPTLPSNNEPVIIPYSDPLVGLGKWPSVSPDWALLKENGASPINFLLRANFDSTQYEGLLNATAKNDREVSLSFSIALDKASAELVDNYSLPGATISKAVLSADNTVIALHVSDLSPDRIYEVTAKDVKAKGKGQAAIYGSARFDLSGNTTGSSLAAKAKQDLVSYRLVQEQMRDPNGVDINIITSFLKTAIFVDEPVKASLLLWIDSIADFISTRSDGNGPGTPPAKTFVFTNPVTEDGLKPGEIQLLSVEFVLSRKIRIIAPGMGPKSGVLDCSTRINPRMEKLGAGDQTIALQQFATDFENACNFPNFRLKVAVGINRKMASITRSGGEVWIIKLGNTIKYGISCSVLNAGNPVILAPRPVANELKTEQVDVMSYQPGTVLDPKAATPPKVSKRFEDVDVDTWMGRFLLAIDDILSPEFMSAMQLLQVLNAAEAGTIIADLLSLKRTLASLIKKSLILLYADEKNGEFVSQAQDIFEQQLLQLLVNAYNIRAGIQFRMKVTANVKQKGDAEPPQLFGPVIQQPTTEQPTTKQQPSNKDNEIHLSSPKLALQSATELPLSIMLAGPAVIKGEGGEIIPSFPLKINYQPNFIEHQIGESYVGDGYRPSSWLHFVLPHSVMNYELGEFDVPSYLRAFPVAQDLTGHGMVDHPNKTSIELSDIIKWDYQFTYSQNIHYPHDTIYCEVDFNVSEQRPAQQINYGNLFPSLAQFIDVLNPVYADIEKNLFPITPSTPAEDPIVKGASTALLSFKNIIQNVIDAANKETGFLIQPRTSTLTSSGVEPFKCRIRESAALIKTIDALLVTIVVPGGLPAGLGEPCIIIDGYTTRRYTLSSEELLNADGVYAYYFEKNNAQKTILSAKDGQQIETRTVVLPDIDIIQRQDAYAAIYVKRNEYTLDRSGERKAADAFVYSSGTVRFNTPLYPTITYAREIDIAQVNPIFAANNNNTLYAHLFNLVSVLLKNNSQEEVVFQLLCNYSFSVNDQLKSPVPVPLMFYPSETINVKANNQAGLDKLIRMWSDVIINQWYTNYQPVDVKKGRLSFDFTIMSNVQIAPKPYPLVHLPNLILNIKDVSDIPPRH